MAQCLKILKALVTVGLYFVAIVDSNATNGVGIKCSFGKVNGGSWATLIFNYNDLSRALFIMRMGGDGRIASNGDALKGTEYEWMWEASNIPLKNISPNPDLILTQYDNKYKLEFRINRKEGRISIIEKKINASWEGVCSRFAPADSRTKF